MKQLIVSFFLLAVSSMAHQVSNIKTDSPEDLSCSTSVSGEYSAQNRCFYGDVMTGIRSINPLQIRCSRITVTCYRKSVPEKNETATE